MECRPVLEDLRYMDRQIDSMEVSMLRPHKHLIGLLKVVLEPEIDLPPPGGSRTLQACPSQAQTCNLPCAMPECYHASDVIKNVGTM